MAPAENPAREARRLVPSAGKASSGPKERGAQAPHYPTPPHNTTIVNPLLPFPRSLLLFSSGMRFSSSQVRSSEVRQFSP